MTDLDQLLDEAASDVQPSIREKTTPTGQIVRRRAQRHTLILATGWMLVAGLAVAGTLVVFTGEGDLASTEDQITSEVILEDGVVTEAEYQAGAQAVADCMTEAGFETRLVEQDTDGYFGFFTPSPFDTKPGYTEQWEHCRELHLSRNVMHGYGATLGDVDLAELRDETTTVFDCVERSTGQDFGELTYDDFGYLTDEGWQNRDAAFEHQDHEPWLKCHSDLGYADEYKTRTKAVFECVEQKAGQDFGELTFNEFGQPTRDSQQALQDAMSAQGGHELWETCSEELGISSSRFRISDF